MKLRNYVIVSITLTVAPRRGAWVETELQADELERLESHPAGVRGLKLENTGHAELNSYVAPRRGAWVETSKACRLSMFLEVAPRRGAWVETRSACPVW